MSNNNLRNSLNYSIWLRFNNWKTVFNLSFVYRAQQHPAPLPGTAPQQVVGGAKKLPPQPTLKLSHKENSEYNPSFHIVYISLVMLRMIVNYNVRTKI